MMVWYQISDVSFINDETDFWRIYAALGHKQFGNNQLSDMFYVATSLSSHIKTKLFPNEYTYYSCFTMSYCGSIQAKNTHTFQAPIQRFNCLMGFCQ